MFNPQQIQPQCQRLADQVDQGQAAASRWLFALQDGAVFEKGVEAVGEVVQVVGQVVGFEFASRRRMGCDARGPASLLLIAGRWTWRLGRRSIPAGSARAAFPPTDWNRRRARRRRRPEADAPAGGRSSRGTIRK